MTSPSSAVYVRSAAVVAAAVLLITVALRPASAEVTSPAPAASWSVSPKPPSPAPTTQPVRWDDGGCATGTIGPLERDAQNHVIIPAVIALCRPWLAKYSFTVVAFRADRPALAFGSPGRIRDCPDEGPGGRVPDAQRKCPSRVPQARRRSKQCDYRRPAADGRPFSGPARAVHR
jgi:hypothetical protein